MKKLIIVTISIFLTACSSTDIREKSPNFHKNEEVFKNSNPIKMHSFWEMLWKGLTTDIESAEWPETVTTTTDKAPLEKAMGDETRITFVNHATFLIQTAGYNILTDPVFSERTSPLSFIGPKRIHNPGIDIANLPKIDVIIISHDHYDHLDLDSINTIIKRDNPKVYMGLGVASRLDESVNILEMDWWDKTEVADNFQLWFLEVQHFSGRTLTDRNSTLWGGYLLQINDKKIYFGGDSGYADHYKETFERFGPVDLAFIPIGAYAPREMFKPIHLNPFEAVQAHTELESKLSIGMHYGTFQLSAEAFAEPIELLEQAKSEAKVPSDDFITLDIGIPYILNHKI